MKNMDRFKCTKNASGKTKWYFQAFKTTRRGFATKREAQLAYLELEKRNRSQKKLTGSNAYFGEVGNKWFKFYRSLNEQKVSTYDKRKEQLDILKRWIGDQKINTLTPELLQELMFTLKEKGVDGQSNGYAKNTLYSLRQVLNMVFEYAVSFSLLSENPLSKTRMPKYKMTVSDLRQVVTNVEEKYLSLDELRTLLNYGLAYEELPLAVLFHVLFYTGCRVSEALALQPEDFDFERNEILFYKQIAMTGKTDEFRIETTKSFASARRVVVTQMVMDKVRELIVVLTKLQEEFIFEQRDLYLFVYLVPGKRGYPFRREYVNDHIKKCVMHSGINKEFHTHLARHTMASLCASYCSLEIIRDRLGHSDKTVTKIYRHITSEEKLKPLDAFNQLES